MNRDLWEFSHDQFREQFPHLAFQLKHNLLDEPMLRIESLVDLCQSLPAEQVEYNSGRLPIQQNPKETPMNGLSAKETIARIRDCESWLVLKHIEHSGPYRMLLERCLAPIEEIARDKIGAVYAREGFIFISSPNSVTPYHMDPEHNILMQIQGNKKVHIWAKNQDQVLQQRDLERFHRGAHRNLHYEDRFAEFEEVYELLPGDALHFPVTVPHWVQNGNEVSVSLSVTFRSEYSEKKKLVHEFNHRLRSAGLTPRSYGQSARSDQSKIFLERCMRRLGL